MGLFFYFVFGALNIGLLYSITAVYMKKTGIDLMPGRAHGDIYDMVVYLLSYFLCGYFGTPILILLGIFLFVLFKREK